MCWCGWEMSWFDWKHRCLNYWNVFWFLTATLSLKVLQYFSHTSSHYNHSTHDVIAYTVHKSCHVNGLQNWLILTEMFVSWSRKTWATEALSSCKERKFFIQFNLHLLTTDQENLIYIILIYIYEKLCFFTVASLLLLHKLKTRRFSSLLY